MHHNCLFIVELIPYFCYFLSRKRPDVNVEIFHRFQSFVFQVRFLSFWPQKCKGCFIASQIYFLNSLLRCIHFQQLLANNWRSSDCLCEFMSQNYSLICSTLPGFEVTIIHSLCLTLMSFSFYN